MTLASTLLTPDTSASEGLYLLWHNANSFAGSRVDVAPSGNTNTVTLSAADSRGGWYVCATGGTNAGWTLNLAATSDIIGLFKPFGRMQVAAGSLAATQTVPFTKLMVVKNLNAQVCTLTAGDVSTTIVGTATMAQNTSRLFLMHFPTATTITIESLGVLASV